MSYTHLSIALRSKLEILQQQGKVSERLPKKWTDIMPLLEKNSAEVRHNTPYCAKTSQKGYIQHRIASVSRGNGIQNWRAASK